MPPKVSAEEKRKRIQSIFHDSGEFYQLKDIEKLGARKGVVMQSVKDVLMSLVDDGLVTMDKIGTSNYFWSYPSAAVQIQKNKFNDLDAKYKKELDRKSKLEESIEQAKEGREQCEDRDALLQQLKEAQKLNKELNAEFQKYKDNDPTTYEAKEKAAKIAKEAANRWTENIWEMESYVVNNFGIEKRVFDEQFGITDDFDTIP